MQNGHEIAAVLKCAAREAKANRAAHLSLVEQTLYILLVASRQHLKRREYHRAYLHQTAWRVLRHHSSIKLAWEHLTQASEPRPDETQTTPVSNTGVTESSAAVPLDYFTGGK